MRRCEDGTGLGQAARRGAMLAITAFSCAFVAGCSSGGKLAGVIDPRYGVTASPRVVEPGEPVPKGGGAYRVGRPYVIGGRTYVPAENADYRAEGVASWYGDDFHGRLTANGEVYDMASISAAHPTLPMPSYVRVTNLANQRSLVVRVNDRGPYHADREIDLSGKAAELLGFRANGLARVRVEYVGRAPLEGSDDRKLIATLREGSPAPAPSAVLVASAKPFLPASYRGGPAPLPPERPYELGDGQAAPAAPSAAAGRSAGLRRTVPADIAAAPLPDLRLAEPRRAAPPVAATAAPVAAYAPVRYQVPAVASGRGIY
jgi:rare lipoprotein A